MEKKINTALILLLLTALFKGFVYVTMVDIDGKRLNLKNEVSNKVILLSFFATTCHPCKKELPELKEMVAELKNKNLEFILVSEDPSDVQSSDITEFLKPIFSDQCPRILRDIYHQQYQLNAEKGAPVSIPRNVVLVNGRAVLDIKGFHEDSIEKVENALSKHLNKKIEKKRSVMVLDFKGNGMEKAKEMKYRSLVKAFCAAKNVIAQDTSDDTSLDTLCFEVKPVGSYELFKVSVNGSDGSNKISKSVVVYQEAESIKKLKKLLDQVFPN